MKNILIVNSSISGEQGQSNQLIENFLQALTTEATVTRLDLNQQQLPHLAMSEIGAWMTPASDRTPEQAEVAALSDTSIAQVQAADVILVGVPMYNFGVPSQLKAWFDRIARAGITFKYTETGPVGLLEDKPVVFFATRGGIYKDLPHDSQTPFLKAFFNFIGLKNLHFVYAEGLNMGAESAQAALTAAKAQIGDLTSQLAA
ncbi:FMN-dependent NADH-azoreductase [Rheinheimera riviphila]|uniref:FMN dependent NADH:quinone oxidoreductase n=1 Tax=Rheinheimera riviphila TaxID=1834037 RepID=A0A437QT09_9GAMM|nr:NAD(P)H-dependent oxidoreductase [Rheinheimera riviphila]RVU37658.1 FMN-dependent NADH-azoreductase [Rheinheimera riviphila]